MKLKQISLFMENKPGALSAPCKALADAGISISTLSLADTHDFGVLRLLVKDWEYAKKVLEDKGFALRLTDVVAIRVDHKPGSLSRILEALDRHSINVEYMYAFAAGLQGKAAIIFRFDDPDTALEKLKGEQLTQIVCQEDLFGAENNN